MSADAKTRKKPPADAHQHAPNDSGITASDRRPTPRVGVFVCHCGINIAKTVDVKRVSEEIAKEPGVVIAEDYQYMCSVPGQQMIVDAVSQHNLNRIIVAACSPKMHEPTFRRAVGKAGLNPYLCEISNIREHCSWVHEDREQATEKAIDITRTILEKIRGDDSLDTTSTPVTKRALVIGGGIAGIQAALDIAGSGYEVILVERESSIGGHMAQLGETFPTLDCASCIFTPKIVEVAQNENIKLLAYSEVESVSGFVGQFEVKIRRKARSVDETVCTGCGICTEKCPTRVADEFNRGLVVHNPDKPRKPFGKRGAIYIPFAQAQPKVATIDRENCRYYQAGKCKVCEKVCGPKAIRFDQKDEIVTEKVGAIVIATGYETLPRGVYGEYGYGKYENVIDGLQLERMLSAAGPTAGDIRRPSDGKVPKEVVWIQCVGSRDESKGIPYCSKICCMYTAKQTRLYKHRVHDGQAYVFYMDIRAGGKRYEEFVKHAQVDEGTVYLRGRVSKIYERGDKLIVMGMDTLSGSQIEIPADMVVLATAIVPQHGTEEFARKLRVGIGENGFIAEAHVKLKPVETSTAGIFIAGAIQAPKDIPDTVAQAGCAASKVLNLFSNDTLTSEPIVASVDEELCSGCGLCIGACAYDARKMDEKKHIVVVEDVLCQGCGACRAACPSSACELKNFRTEQFINMVDAIT
ncbi:MAG: CoB--CoM heterodisulfide reductase iron-sulfur subunit A family protein [Planctomycetes bacterium]|nr:CoB--CoM heterodisulfide reductase iron-sulfur subunit A family protein [Planctomycetota bacterium]